jgi:hypothetical protein
MTPGQRTTVELGGTVAQASNCQQADLTRCLLEERTAVTAASKTRQGTGWTRLGLFSFLFSISSVELHARHFVLVLL